MVTSDVLLEARAKVYQRVVDELEARGFDADYREYSGRAMFGAEVPAIVTNASGPLVGFVVGLIAEGSTLDERIEADDLLPDRVDQTGLSNQVYY